MADSMLIKETDVYSSKHDIHGVVRDYGVVTKLFFTYAGKDMVMGIDHFLQAGNSMEEIGRDIIDAYVSTHPAHIANRKLQLHYWYIDEHERNGERFRIAHGIVTGHNRLMDSTYMHSSSVQEIRINEDEGEAVITTKNSVYYCPLEYCNFDKQNGYPGLIPEFISIREKYEDRIMYPSIEPGKVLLVLANFCEYYFHSLYYVPTDSENGKPIVYRNNAHIGTFQDSYLVHTNDYKIDLSYFPHFQNIEFYSVITDGCPLFIENIGDDVLYVRASVGTIRLDPGNRKEITEENAEVDPPVLPGGDLYPAWIM